jgi:hypothetical protein
VDLEIQDAHVPRRHALQYRRGVDDAVEPYEPLAGRARYVTVSLLVMAGLLMIGFVFDYLEFRIAQRLIDGEAITRAEARASDDRQQSVALAQFMMLVLCGIAYVRWFRRAYGNLPALGSAELRYRRGWAVWGWFVPVLALWRPKQLANDIWRATEPGLPWNAGAGLWGRAPVPRLITAWWVLWIAGGAMATWSLTIPGHTAEQLRGRAVLDMATDTVLLVCAALACLMVSEIGQRQARRAADEPA